MNDYVIKLNIDINCQKSAIRLFMGQYDIGRKVEVTVTADGEPYSCQNCTVVCQGVRGDKTHFAFDCAVNSDGHITTTFDEILKSSGIAYAKFVISDSTHSYSTEKIIIDCDNALLGNIVNVNDYVILNQLIERLHALSESGAVLVDTELSENSSNPIANYVIASIISSVNKSLDKKADDATTLAGYGITDAYTQTQTDALLANLQETTNNLCDEKFVSGYYINFTNGAVGVNTDGWGYYGTYIPINVGQSITFSSPNITNIELNIIIVYYDENKEYAGSFGGRTISETSRQFSVTFSKESAKYFRFNLRNVDDFVNNGFNLMVEYGSSASAYIPHIVAKNTEKIQELEDKFENEVTEFTVYGATYMEYSDTPISYFIPRKNSYSASTVHISNGNLLYDLTYYNNNLSNFYGSNVSENTSRVRTNSFLIPSGCEIFTLSGVDTSLINLMSVRAFDYRKNIVSSGVVALNEDGSYKIKVGYEAAYIHLLFGSVDDSVIDPTDVAEMEMMLNIGTNAVPYISAERTSLTIPSGKFDTKIAMSATYKPYSNNVMYSHGPATTFDYVVKDKPRLVINDLMESNGEYKKSKFFKKCRISPDYRFEYYNPTISEKFTIDTTTDQYMTAVNDLMNISDGYIKRTSSGIKDASGTWTLFTYWLSDPNSVTDKPTIELICNQHGYEKNAAFAAYWLMDILCNHWTDNEMLIHLHQDFNFVITPLVNPWGFNKYKSDVAGTETGYTNVNGTNINRDFENFESPEAQYVRQVTQPNTMLSIDVHGNGSTRTMNEYTAINWLSFNTQGDITSLESAKYYLNTLASHITKEMNIDYQKVGRYSFTTGNPTVTSFWSKMNKSNLCFEVPCRLPNEGQIEFSTNCQKYGVEMLINYIGMFIAYYNNDN